MIVKINGNTLAPVEGVKEIVAASRGIKIMDGFIIATRGITQFAAAAVVTNHGLGSLISAYLGIVDYLAWGVFAFAGTAWMFGHRNVAIEKLIGGVAGMLIILHAWDFVAFLRNLK